MLSRQQPGVPGSFDVQHSSTSSTSTGNNHSSSRSEEGDEGGGDLAARLLRTHVLSDGSSLIGQLCPGLRLCLAAEVATGLVCDRWGLAGSGGRAGGRGWMVFNGVMALGCAAHALLQVVP